MTAPALNAVVQGQGSVSADNLNTYEQTCNLVPELRGFIGLPGVQVCARGLVTIGDGGGGFFYWDAASVGPDNGTSIIVPLGAATGAWLRLTIGTSTVATRQIFTSGTGTYQRPTACNQLRVRMYGGGSGGNATGSAGFTASSNGGNTTFASITANGSVAGLGNHPGVGGTGGAGAASVRLAGFTGVGGTNPINGADLTVGIGGNGGGPGGGLAGGASAGGNAVANTGSGGGGGGIGPGTFAAYGAIANSAGVGPGGGSGEYVELIINTPNSTYAYIVGAGGAGGGAGTSGFNGGNGAAGIIIVDEFY